MLAECVSAKNTDEFKHLYVAVLYLFRLNCFYFSIVTMLCQISGKHLGLALNTSFVHPAVDGPTPCEKQQETSNCSRPSCCLVGLW